MNYSISSRPITLSASTQSAVYGLFALAMAITFIGGYIGMLYASTLFSTPVFLLLTILELGLIFTSSFWAPKYPLNYLLFGLFPLLSGITVTPYLLSISAVYANGSTILLNAIAATVCLSLAAVLLARVAPGLASWGRALFFSLIGIIALSLLQIFVPALRTQGVELLLSGAGVLLFSVFTAYDLQRIEQMGKLGANPFMLALSLYLDIFNLFLMVLRFMTALSGERR